MEFNCVYSKKAITVKRFLKTVKADEVINYMDITNKLTKNDINSIEPSDEIINSYLIKYLKKLIVETDDDKEVFYYVISELNPDMIDNLQCYIEQLANEEIDFRLWVKDEPEGETEFQATEMFSEVLTIPTK